MGIYVQSSIPLPEIEECQQVCQDSTNCTFFTWNDGSCGIRDYSPTAFVNGDPKQRSETKTSIFPKFFDGKVFVGLAVKAGSVADCQKSCQGDEQCQSWTWNGAGGPNPDICVHNYYKTERKLCIPNSSQIVSGPKTCKPGCLPGWRMNGRKCYK